MEKLFNVLTEIDRENITNYIDTFAVENAGRFASIEHILRLWEEGKSVYLYDLFDKNLILEKDVEFTQHKQILVDELERNKAFNDFRAKYKAWVNKIFNKNGYTDYSPAWVNLYCLLNSDDIIQNEYEGNTFEFDFKEKTYKVQHGCKIMRTLQKIAKLANLEKEYEDFRLAHSMILNSSKIHGALCLSIHPLDYMTMSDNASRWSSCMGWQNPDGCYKQGTVEMMNSKCVVVAYVKGSESMTLPNGNKWNNKKWRQLFIVDKGIICSIKSYPYFNEELTKITNEWLRELAEKNLEWKDYGTEQYLIKPFEDYQYGNRTIDFDFECDKMYNDFGSTKHFGFINNNLEETYYEINYSGPSECMSCGDEYPYLENEGYLVCTDHMDALDSYCDECGSVWDSDDMCYVDGVALCPDCYDSLTAYCDIERESHLQSNIIHFVVCNEDFTEKYEDLSGNIYYFSLFKKIFKTCLDISKVKINMSGDHDYFCEIYIPKSAFKTNKILVDDRWRGTIEEPLFFYLDESFNAKPQYKNIYKYSLKISTTNLEYYKDILDDDDDFYYNFRRRTMKNYYSEIIDKN